MITARFSSSVSAVLLFLFLLFSIECRAAEWQPIPGIPQPVFGIVESHTDFQGKTYDYGSGSEPYRIGPNGPYTHYVDPRHPNASNTDNPYGTHTKPRISYPTMRKLPPGSVVELHGGPFGGERFEGSGTAAAPIFIRGVPADPPQVKPPYTIAGDYYIFENIDFDFDKINRSAFFIGYQGLSRTHIAIRNNEFHNLEEIPSTGRAIIPILYKTGTEKLKNILISGNHFHHLGHGRTGGKYDVTAVFPGPNAEKIWIVDNHFHHIGGDGIQLNMDGADQQASPPNHVYIGRNTFHDNFENAVDLKMCQDVIISKNLAYNFGATYSEIGSGASSAFRYGGADATPGSLARNNIWTIFNQVYHSDSPDGAFLSYNTESEEFADQIFYLGNIVRDCHNTNNSATAFGWWNQKRVYAANNTIYNVDNAFSAAGERPQYPHTNEKITIVNNIIGNLNLQAAAPRHLNIYGTPASLDRSFISHNLFYQSSAAAIIRWGVYSDRVHWNSYSLSEFRSIRPDKTAGSSEADPKFLDAANANLRILEDSPARNAGTLHGLYQLFFDRYQNKIDVDFAGNVLSKDSIDIGAFEYLDAAPLPPKDLKVDGS